VILIAIPLILAAAVFVVVATTAAHARSATGSLGRETRRADRSSTTNRVTSDLDKEARARYEEAKASLEPPREASPVGSAGRGLVHFGPPADPEGLEVSRRQFFNRGILAVQSLALGSFGLAVIGFLWPSLSGGFGAKINAGRLSDIMDTIKEKSAPLYVPEARSYINPYPEVALPEAKQVYSESILAGMEQGVVALFQKCPHLGCRVPWCQTSQWFECPCHGSKYNRVGEKKGGPAPRGMDRFPIDVSGGNVVVNTGIVVQGPAIGTNTTGQEAEGPNCV
jgi:cytochrome b6-f complex iron-sulfur subunit